MPILVVFHNLNGYDAHLLMQSMADVYGEIKCIPNNMEKYISFSLGNLRFIDSLNFLEATLDSLVKCSEPESFRFTEMYQRDPEKRELLLQNGIYHYEYMDSIERFSEKKLPAKRSCRASLQTNTFRTNSKSTRRKYSEPLAEKTSATTMTCTWRRT